MTKIQFATRELDIPLKGSRTYVRGADIYSAVMKIVSEKWIPTGRCRLAFRRMPHRRLELLIGQSKEIELASDDAVADFSVVCGGVSVFGRIRETDLIISERRSFDEGRILGDPNIVDKTIFTKGSRDCQPIDLVVALTKRLHDRLRPLVTGQWIFSRLDIERPLIDTDTEEMSVQILQELGARLTRSEIRIAQQHIGSIFFSVLST